jgi:hypothetical protein
MKLPQRQTLAERLRLLERRLQLALVGWIMTVGVAFFAGRPGSGLTVEQLRVRALIVVDEVGRERVVLGAPIPDLAVGMVGLARGRPANGLLIVDERGRNRVAVGAPKPDPQINSLQARRISPSTGIQINNFEGNERGGFGYLANGRVTLGLDWDGPEALTMAVRPEGGTRLRVAGPGRSSRLRVVFGVVRADSLSLLQLFDRSGTPRTRFGAPARGATVFEMLDAQGRPVQPQSPGQ